MTQWMLAFFSRNLDLETQVCDWNFVDVLCNSTLLIDLELHFIDPFDMVNGE